MERISKQDCLFSVERTDIVEESIKFIFRNDSKKYKDFSVLKLVDLQMKVTEKFAYLLFIVPDRIFLTGYVYDFKIEAKTCNEETLSYTYEGHLLRGMTGTFFYLNFETRLL